MSLQMDLHHKVVVDRVEAFANAAAGDTPHIGGLCRQFGVTARNLRKAFRVVYGLTPYRCLRAKRMQQAREMLLDAPLGSTVTSIAMHFGFLELGRFSVEYRAAFGERPSDTLRRSRAIRRSSSPQ